MLAVQASARQANRSSPCIRQVAKSVSLLRRPAGGRRDRVGLRVPGHWAGMSGGWACPAGRTTEAGASSPKCCPTRVSRSRTRSCSCMIVARCAAIVARSSTTSACRVLIPDGITQQNGQRNPPGTLPRHDPVSGCHCWLLVVPKR
jgi:hypothetical protein